MPEHTPFLVSHESVLHIHIRYHYRIECLHDPRGKPGDRMGLHMPLLLCPGACKPTALPHLWSTLDIEIDTRHHLHTLYQNTYLASPWLAVHGSAIPLPLQLQFNRALAIAWLQVSKNLQMLVMLQYIRCSMAEIQYSCTHCKYFGRWVVHEAAGGRIWLGAGHTDCEIGRLDRQSAWAIHHMEVLMGPSKQRRVHRRMEHVHSGTLDANACCSARNNASAKD